MRKGTDLSSAVFARCTRFFVQSPVARMGVCVAEEEAWADELAVVVAIDLFKIQRWGFLGESAHLRVLRELSRLFPPSSHAFPGSHRNYSPSASRSCHLLAMDSVLFHRASNSKKISR